MIGAGEFDRRVTLYSPAAPVDDGYTTTPGGHSNAGERWARFIPATPREIFTSGGREAELPAVFELRSDTLTRTIRATWRLAYGGQTFDVVGVQEVGRNDTLRLTCVGAD